MEAVCTLINKKKGPSPFYFKAMRVALYLQTSVLVLYVALFQSLLLV
jgi:hypothetical protein